MSNTDLCLLNVTELAPLIQARKISPVDLVQALLSRIDTLNDTLLAYLHVSAAQIDPSDYAPTPEEGILRVCQLSDAHQILAKAFADALFPVSPDVDTHADH